MPPKKIRPGHVIRRLEASVSELERVVAALCEQQAAARARNWYAAAAVRQCDAMLELGAALGRRAAGGGGAGGGGGAAAPRCGHPPGGARRGAFGDLLTHIRDAHHTALAGAAAAAPPEGGRGGACGLGGGGGPALGAAEAEVESLGWSPSAAAAKFAEGFDPSSDAARKVVRDFVMQAGLLLPRARSGAPDAAASLRRLAHGRARILEVGALLVVTANTLPLSDVLLTALDTDDADADPDTRAARAPAADMPDAHWLWAAREARLESHQEEQLYVLLLQHYSRLATVKARTKELLDKVCLVHDLGAREEHVREINALQSTYQIETMVFSLAIYTSLMRPDQFASYYLAAWPYVPTHSGMLRALELFREERKRPPPTPLAPPPPRSRPRGAGRPPLAPGARGEHVDCMEEDVDDEDEGEDVGEEFVMDDLAEGQDGGAGSGGAP
ncbi:MAG: hypothetical protein J3K34DRAFT_519816 [Monoraphidium minutum]|nr:MAG: hypothetical protein J3K34DRAFT_519816 [Monoraphidium minutum]